MKRRSMSKPSKPLSCWRTLSGNSPPTSALPDSISVHTWPTSSGPEARSFSIAAICSSTDFTYSLVHLANLPGSGTWGPPNGKGNCAAAEPDRAAARMSTARAGSRRMGCLRQLIGQAHSTAVTGCGRIHYRSITNCSGWIPPALGTREPAPAAPCAQHVGQRGAQRRRALCHGDTSRPHGFHLVLGLALAARNDGAGMAHTTSRRCGPPGDKAGHRLGAAALGLRLYEFCRVLLGRAANFPDDDDGVGSRVGEEHFKHGDELGPLHRIAADADRGRLAQSGVGGLLYRLVGERA